MHRVKVLDGEVGVGDAAHSEVDIERRRSISRAHTATHMVHKAFREALGETATQAGSENAPGRFRFDFSATGAVPTSVLHDVEARVNDLVLADLGVHAELMTQDEAVRSGAMALFGEKYGDQVRVISVGDWARELCGGTHAGRSGQLGVIKLLGEASIGSGVRRVEALVGADAYRFLAREHVLVSQLSEALKVRPEELPERVGDIVERLRAAEKEIEKHRVGQVLAAGGSLAAGAQDVHGVQVVAQRVDGASGGDVRTLALDVRGRLPGDRPGVVVVVGRHRLGRGHQGLGRRGGQRRRARPRPQRQHAGRSRRSAGRRPGRRQGRRGPGRRQRREPGGRGAGPGPLRGRPRGRLVRPGLSGGPCGTAYGSASTPATPGSGSPAATRPGSWRPRSRRCGGGRATCAGSSRLAAEHDAVEVVVGLPRSLSGGEGPAAVKVRAFAATPRRRRWWRCRCDSSTSV